jgi:hypothetical protein
MKLRKRGWGGGYGLDSSGSGQMPEDGSCEHGNEPSVSTKLWEILEEPRDWVCFSRRTQLRGVAYLISYI